MKYCKKCKKEYSESENFCEECGSKLVEFVEKIEKPKPEILQVKKPSVGRPKWQWGLFAIIAVVCVIFLLGLFNSYMTGFTIRGETTKTIQCREVQEPYTIQVPYTYTFKYSVVDSKLERLWNLELGDYTKGTVIVANSEDIGGIFTVNYEFRTVDKTVQRTDSKYISGHSTQTFEFIYDSQIGEDVRGFYTINPATETRYREEIRYRTVQKCD